MMEQRARVTMEVIIARSSTEWRQDSGRTRRVMGPKMYVHEMVAVTEQPVAVSRVLEMGFLNS